MIADSLLQQLKDLVGPVGLVSGDVLAARTSGFWNEPVDATLLVRPGSVEEVFAVLSLCHRHDQPVVVDGGGTGLVAGTTTKSSELLLSTERLRTIEEVDPVGRTLTAQSGCVLQDIQLAAANHGLNFPLDLGARGSCTIGGNLATNAGGIAVIRHGMARDLVLGVEAVLADGTMISSLYPFIKNNTGYDLKQLFIGSEGTLGVITRAVLKLAPASSARETAMIGCETFDQVTGLLNHLSDASGGSVSAFEVLWGNYYQLLVDEMKLDPPPIKTGHGFYVLADLDQPRRMAEGCASISDILEDALGLGLIGDATIATSEAQRASLWAIREDTEVVSNLKPVVIYDVGLAIRDMPAYITALASNLNAQWGNNHLYVWGHLGDGNLHLAVSAGNPDGSENDAVDEVVFSTLRDFHGSVSAEHGIGLKRKKYLSYTRSAEEIELMQRLKLALDPKNLLNRGKVLDMP